MIDGGDDVIKTELKMGKQQIVLGNGRKGFIFAHEVVAEVADGSAKKMRQTRRRLNPRGGEKWAEASERPSRRTLAAIVDSSRILPLLPVQYRKGTTSQVGIATQITWSLPAFK